jgi:GNAT superfamily N-acetyltransferase
VHLDIRQEPYDGPAAQQLISEVQVEYVARYGSPDETPVDASEFMPPNGRFVIAYADNEPVAIGGLRRLEDGTAELKRMYVRPAYRRRGLSRLVLGHLEALAVEMGAQRIVLETGDRQPEAMRLYESSGYEHVEPFGHYRCSPGSAHYGKTLPTSSTQQPAVTTR